MANVLVNDRNVRRSLAAGFTLVIFLLLADALVGFYSIQSIQTAAAELAEDQFTQMALVDEIQREQDSLSAIFHTLSGDPESVNRDQILAQIEVTERNIRGIVKKAPASPDEQVFWRRLISSSSQFADEARRLLAIPNAHSFQSGELLRRHEEVLNAVSGLIRLTHKKARMAKERIESLAQEQLRRDLILLGGSVVLALVCGFLVLRTSTRLYQQIAEQSEQLSRVSWQLLDNQEMVARRLSHELHDELGQALTALKTTLTRHLKAGCADPAWVEDCSNLLKESIRSAHEISQLLRPTILDDFGLTSALNWLCERFSERTGMDVEFVSRFEGRLSPETETHLFRIAQEALTNAARHSDASRVKLELRQDGDLVYLAIEDNGKGLPRPEEMRKGAFGLIGMRARAQSSKGELKIESQPGRGTRIEVSVPYASAGDEAKDPHFIG